MKRLKNLRVRFALWAAALLLAALTGFSIFVYTSLTSSLSAALDDSLRLSASQAIASINMENGQINFSDSIPEGTAAANLVERGLTIRILSPQSDILQSFGPYRAMPIDTPSLDAAIQGQATFKTATDPQEGDVVRFFTAPIVENKILVGIVQVGQDLGNIQDTQERLLAALLLAAPLLVGLVGLGGYFLSAHALAPIDAMITTANRISADDLSARLNLPATDDEIGRLAATFDRMLSRLDESFRRERQFTADASHELRTPLTAMQAILSVIREERGSPEEFNEALADLTEETERLQALAEDLLLLSRNDLLQRMISETIDLSALLHDVCDSLRPLAEAKGLTLMCNASGDLTMTGDRDGLVRLFVNLLDNAIQYTEQGGITLSASRENKDSLRVNLTDTGRGIAPEHLPHIFDRFYQADKSRSTRGAGLGLAIALEIARAHGGTIEVHSEVGKGTTFSLRLNKGKN
jgi:heavy metal sensor kinase